jgi:hypothetical protein
LSTRDGSDELHRLVYFVCRLVTRYGPGVYSVAPETVKVALIALALACETTGYGAKENEAPDVPLTVNWRRSAA